MRRSASMPDWAVLAGFILIASAMLTFGTSDRVHDADSLLSAVMSLKKLTWYYWSQNRFGNLLPFLASPVRGVLANFYVQIFLRHLCGFASVFFVLLLAGQRGRVYDFFFVSVLALFLTAGSFVTSFFNPALAQPVSCAVFAAGLWLRGWCAGGRPSGPGRALFLWTAQTAIFWLAFFVNLSLLVLVVPLGLGVWLLRIPSPLARGSVCWSLLVAAGLAWWHAQQFPPLTPAGFNLRWSALNVAFGAVASQVNLTALAILLIGSAGMAALARRLHPVPAGQVTISPQIPALLAAITLTAAVYADSVWVQLNLDEARYFNVIALCLVVLAARCALLLVCRGFVPVAERLPAAWQRWLRRAWHVALPAATLLAVAVHAGPPGRLTFVTDARPDPLAVNADVPAILAHVPPGRPMLVSGNYWTAIPLVFARLERKGGRDSYAAVFHWEPMIPEIRALMGSGRPFTLVCLPPNTPDCLGRVLDWSGAAPGASTTLAYGPAHLGDGGTYTILAVNAPPSNPR